MSATKSALPPTLLLNYKDKQATDIHLGREKVKETYEDKQREKIKAPDNTAQHSAADGSIHWIHSGYNKYRCACV